MRIAVIGSGIAGLTAVWRLGPHHHVELFEARPALGMDSSSVDVPLGTQTVRVDVPLRVYGSGYYPRLLSLYAEAGITRGPADYSASYGKLGGESYFAYRSYTARDRALSLPDLRLGTLADNLVRSAHGTRFYLQEPARLAAGRVPEVRIDEYLRGRGYAERFTEGVLYPTLGAILTCPLSAARAQPASAVIDFFARTVGKSFARVASGTQQVVQRLSARAAALRLGTKVRGVIREGGQVSLSPESGPKERFDHVIFATQVHHIEGMLEDLRPDEAEVFAPFEHTRFECVVHDDPALMPRRRGDWRPINALTQGPDAMPMYTMWMNAILPHLQGAPPLFQTINPLIPPRPQGVHARVQLDRPLLSLKTLPAVRALQRLHQEPGRRVWFTGSYATEGFPLLEAATVSADRVAQRILQSP